MSEKRKWIVVSVVGTAAILVFGAIGGMVYAQTGATPTASTPAVNPQTIFADKLAGILGLDNRTVEDAFTQVQADMQKERAAAQLKQRDEQIAQLVADGKITSEEAGKYKSWIDSRPDINVPGLDMLGGPGGGGPGGGGHGGPGGGGMPGGRGGGPGCGPGGMGGPPDGHGNAPASSATP